MAYNAPFWDDKYDRDEYIYGIEPNDWLRKKLPGLKPGQILFAAEGEGRNSVYAASLGWDVKAFDVSEVGRQKALRLAKQKKVSISYDLADIAEFSTGEYDALGMFFTHFPPDQKERLLRRMVNLLKPEGALIMEVFSRKQLQYQETHNSGGPGDINMLYSIQELLGILHDMDLRDIYETEVELNEGKGHHGKASVIRVFGIKN